MEDFSTESTSCERQRRGGRVVRWSRATATSRQHKKLPTIDYVNMTKRPAPRVTISTSVASRATPPTRLTPLPSRPTDDERYERERVDDDPFIVTAMVVAAARSPPKRYPRLQTLASLAHDHVTAMHNGDFVTRSRTRWQQLQQRTTTESDSARAHRVSRESAALVVQSAWRRSAAVRLRARLVRGIWQQQVELAAWLTRDRDQLQGILDTLVDAMNMRRPLAATRRVMEAYAVGGYRFATLSGAFFRLPALLLAVWLCFALGIRRRSRFLRRPAPIILHTVHIPVRRTCRIYTRLWKELSWCAARTIQCRARAVIARCKYWKLLAAHRRARAAVRLQSLYRAWVARRLVWRLRRRRAAIRLQCAWRRFRARQHVAKRRISLVATHFLTGVVIQAVEHATIEIIHRAARQIQRTFRGQRARAQFRVLVARRYQQHWYRNPSRGYRLFASRCYLQAAVYLDRCFRQGMFQDEGDVRTSEPEQRPVSRGHAAKRTRNKLLPNGSRLTFSFSEAPTPLDSDLVPNGEPRRMHHDRRPASPSHDPLRSALRTSSAARQLEFWQTYALSHWFSFQSNGDPLHLRQARIGFETFMRLDSSSLRDSIMPSAVEAQLQVIRLHTRVCLVHCVYWSRKPQSGATICGDSALALALCIETLDELDLVSGLTTSEIVHQAVVWRAQLLMISASLYLAEVQVDMCCVQLRTLLVMIQQGTCSIYEEVDLRFLLAVVLLLPHQGQQSPTAVAEAEVNLKMCYQEVELWTGVGFYHGELSTSDAAARLQDEPAGSFLLHHEHHGSSAGRPATEDGKDVVSDRKLMLKVKLSDDPCKVSSLRIHKEGDLYHTKKLPNCSHFSVHELIQQLPPAAGIFWSRGVRREIYVEVLRSKLASNSKISMKRRALMLPWEQWRWRTSASSSRHNECWGALCHVFAARLEASDAHEMAAVVARDGLLVARDRAQRAELFFTIGRVSFQLQRRIDTMLAMKQAAIESARLPPPFNCNYVAILRAMNHVGTQGHSFANQLDRVAKLERMCVKALSLDSCSPSLRGHPFCESLLLQRIDDEVAHESVADTFFLRALMRAHVKAFLSKGSCEPLHIERAFVCVRRLFERFRHIGTSFEESNGLRECARHVSTSLIHGMNRTSFATSSEFSLNAMLLIWHRMPFQIAFEMAEVFYRWPLMDPSVIVNVYESLYGRLRGAKPRSWAYAAYEELLLVRLAFLYLQRAVDTTDELSPILHARKAIEFMDELIGLRRLRGLGSNIIMPLKRINWPSPSSTLRFPILFSQHELLFIRGFLWDKANHFSSSRKVALVAAEANAWRDFDSLHRELLNLVAIEQDEERRTSDRQKKLKGVRVFVGETANVNVTDVLYSKPFVVVQCEQQQLTTQHAATWMNQLSPGWNEYMEIDTSSSKARLKVSIMNRSTRLRHRQAAEEQMLGYVQVYLEALLTNSGAQRPQWYDLICSDASSVFARSGTRPRIRLAFQVMMQTAKPQDPSLSGRGTRKMRGNWDVMELKQQLHGDLRRFVGTPWIWRWYAGKWLSDRDFSIAAWFLQRAIDLSRMSNASSEKEKLEYAADVVDLAKCYRGTMGSSWLDYAREMLEEAGTIFQAAYERGGSCDVILWKHLSTISSMLDAEHVPQTPLAHELTKQIPASSNWIAMQTRRRDSLYYFNEDTCERFTGVEGEPHMRCPLEWEPDGDRAVVMMTSRDPSRPRRVVIMSTKMKSRVVFHCKQQQDLHERDPYEWVAVYNPRKQMMQFLSLTADVSNNSSSSLTMTTDQPRSYAMLADTFLMYHVLVVQDAFRKYQRRCRRRRLIRGLLRSSFALASERRAAQTRIALRAETKRKQALNCLHLVVERATKLRAMDLFTSDPYVVIELVDAEGDVVAKGKTSVRRNTLNPQWHEEFHLQYAFVDHEQQQQQHKQVPMLRLRIFDRDIVRTRRRDDDEAKEAIDAEDSDGSEDEDIVNTEKIPKHDFLGLAATPIEPFVHGKCVSADLVLRDEDEEEDAEDEVNRGGKPSTSRSRGTITITVQWIHESKQDQSITHTRRNAVKPMLLVRPRKRVRPKPTLSTAWCDKLAIAMAARTQVLTCMADICVLLDQLIRLFKRWRVAQASGRTADEAKLMEQRMRAATTAPQPFHGKYTALVAATETAYAAFKELLDDLEPPIHDWIESCEKQAASTFSATLSTAQTSIQASCELLSSAWDSDILAFANCVERVLALRHTVPTWRREVLELLKTFFEPPLPTWHESESVAITVEQFAQMHNMLQSTPDDGSTRPLTAKTAASASTKAPSTSALSSSQGGSTVATIGITPTPTPTNAAVAKRMKRIEREKRKAKKQQGAKQ